MITVAIFIGGHDWSITILDDEKVLAIIQEDRISKIKHDTLFPLISLEKVPQYTKVIDNLIICPPSPYEEIITNYFKKLKIKVYNIIIPPLSSHHIFHASSGYYGSGFKEAVCISIDGYGGAEKLPTTRSNIGYYTTTIFSKSNTSSEFVQEYGNMIYNPNYEDPFNNYNPSLKDNIDINHNLDIGVMYGTITRYLGFKHLEAGKTMGLSSYGSINNQLPPIFYNDTILGNMNLFKGDFLIDIKNNPILQDNSNFKIMVDISYSIQKSLEKVFIYRVNQALKLFPTKNIVFSGGCALNVVGNYVVKKEFPDINFYFDPIGTDSGQSYGAAKYYYHKLTNSLKQEPLKHLYHGPRYSKEDLLNSIKKYV
jgi:carbamoyltransferase